MFDAKRLLDQFLGNQGAGGGNDAQQQQGGGMLDALTGGGQRGGGLAGGIGGALGSVNDYAKQNPLLAGALSGGLASVLMGSKGGRKLATNALTYGGIAVVGGLAYKAYRDYQAKQQGQQPAAQAPATLSRPASSGVPILPPPSDSPFALANAPQGADRFAQVLVTAMIAAAKADGHVDGEEQKRILGKLSENGLDPDEVAFLTQELTSPLDIDKVVKGAMNKEEAVEIYAASLIAITTDHPAERAYLDMLAARLGLEPELARTIEHTIEGATV